MKKKPLVAIVGRPNVGKSTLFNRMVGFRMSIVDDIPGVTRDRLYGEVNWLNRTFTLIDTGGITPQSQDVLLQNIRTQAQLAMETADVILFVTDAKEGLTPDDDEVAQMLRQTRKPVILVVNKVDRFDGSIDYSEFYALGFDTLMPVSALQALSIGDLLDCIFSFFSEDDFEQEETEKTAIAVVGKPNAGKSSLVNSILKEDRVLVSEIPGTTRDAVDTPFVHDGKNYVIIDTAGMRRKSKIEKNSLERYSVLRALTAIRRCDVALVLIDAQEGVTEQDVKIAGYVHETGKPCILVVNKWDLVEKDARTTEKYKNVIAQKLSFMRYAPVLFISALTGQRVQRIFPLVEEVLQHAAFRVQTGALNDVLNDALMMQVPPAVGGKRLKVFYGAQTGVKPPTFTLTVNDMACVYFAYERYLENQIRNAFDFSGTPIKIQYQLKDKGDVTK